MRALARALLLSFLTGLAAAQTVDDESEAPPEEEVEDLDAPLEKKRDFTFAHPGKTGLRQALNTAGKATRDYEGRVIQGEMDVLLAPIVDGKDDPLLTQRAKNMGKGLSYVHVLEYDEKTGKHILVFRDDILWYAVYPVRAGETKADEVARRYGDSPKFTTSRRKVEGAEHSARVHWFPESGVGFAQLDGKEAFSYKVVFEAKAKR